MEEITLREVARQFDDLYFKIEAVNSLAYVMVLASNNDSDSLASDLNGALRMLSDETGYIFDKVDKLCERLYETNRMQKAKVNDEE